MTQDDAVNLLRERLRNRARQMEQSATEMMRASVNAMEGGDAIGAAREQTIAAREYVWASWLWLDAADGGGSQRCAELGDAVRAGEWEEPL
jgi:hypothetical protein